MVLAFSGRHNHLAEGFAIEINDGTDDKLRGFVCEEEIRDKAENRIEKCIFFLKIKNNKKEADFAASLSI
jgi:hypothetical protein